MAQNLKEYMHAALRSEAQKRMTTQHEQDFKVMTLGHLIHFC